MPPKTEFIKAGVQISYFHQYPIPVPLYDYDICVKVLSPCRECIKKVLTSWDLSLIRTRIKFLDKYPSLKKCVIFFVFLTMIKHLTNIYKNSLSSFISRGDFSWEGGVALPKIAINLPRTFEKLHCKGEPYRFNGFRHPSIQNDSKRGLVPNFHRHVLSFVGFKKL